MSEAETSLLVLAPSEQRLSREAAITCRERVLRQVFAPRSGRTVAMVAAAIAATIGLSVAGPALATSGHHSAIKAYYGDRTTNIDDPVTNDGKVVKLHTFAHHGAYARQTRHIAKRARAYLKQQKSHLRGHLHGKRRAIVLDVDDTTLNTYNYEIYAHFRHNRADELAFINARLFPAVPGMVRLVKAARHNGYAVFYLTSRRPSRLVGTRGNLAKDGYPAAPNNHFYLKDLGAPWLSGCKRSCTTTRYKSLTRRHIQRRGYRIVANFGDQFSDLRGGHADRRFKLPNPMYRLP